jgi:TonB family protein
MSVLIDASIKVAIVVLLALVGVGLMRGRAAAARHWVLAVAVACAIAMPIVTVMVPEWTIAVARAPLSPPDVAFPSITPTIIPQNEPQRRDRVEAEPGRNNPAPSAVTVFGAIATIWAAGAASTGLLLVVGLTRLKRMAAAAQPLDSGPWRRHADEIGRLAGLRRSVVVLQSDHPTLLVTWGCRRPKVILPASARAWTDERARIVLSHEIAHIRRGDWAAQILGELLRAVYWFNPLVWVACRRLRRESEQACDDAVLQSGIDPTDYASHLLELARTLNGRHAHVPAPAMARASSLEGRITAMLNDRLDRQPLTSGIRIATAAAFLVVTLSIAGAAQSRYSTFSGTVVDQTNGFLPNTTLVLTNAASQARHEVRSDRTGHFEFVGLPSGEYSLQVTQMGFASLTETLAIDRDVSRTIQLQVGSLEETITISGGPSTSPPDPNRAEKQQAIREKAQERQQRANERCVGAASGGMGGNILQPWKLVDVKPVYPDHLRSAGVSGVVTMDALIGTDGTVRDVRVVSSPHPDLDRAAIDAVRRWEFTATILNCTPIDVRMKVTALFKP